MRVRSFALVILSVSFVTTSSSAQYLYGEGEDQACAVARDAAQSAASELASTSQRLSRCAANEDFENDCSTEFRRVRFAHSDYESAVSEVQSDCD